MKDKNYRPAPDDPGYDAYIAARAKRRKRRMFWRDWGWTICTSVFVILLLGFSFLGPAVWTQAEDAIQIAEDQGYSNVEINGSDWLFASWHGCAQGDGRAVYITAINPTGQEVDVTVCIGWPLKGSTVRS